MLTKCLHLTTTTKKDDTTSKNDNFSYNKTKTSRWHEEEKKIKQITYRETDGSTFTFICKLQKCLTHQRTKKFTTEVEKMIQSYLFKTI